MVSRDRLLRGALALPTAAYVVAFFVVPLVVIVVYSFARVSLVTFDISFDWNLDNYRRIHDPLYFDTLTRSVVLSVGATVGCLLLGFPLAYFISRQPRHWQRVLLVFVIVPFWTSFIVRTYATVNLLEEHGPLADLLRALHVINGPLTILYTPKAVAIGIIYSYLPLMVLPIYVSLERIDPALFDASADLGATPWRQFRRVVFPMALPGLIAGIIIVGVPALGEYVIPEILGGGKTFMAGNILADQFLETVNYPFGSALAVSVMVVLLILLFLLRRAQPEADPR
jgi:ABC-type spermidine/putrescine transport system permease subunit I